MQHEVGSIVEGKVTGITKFGAFVELEGGSVGMVHISEVSQSYVNDISEYLKEGETVKVKILNVGDDGKISLSIKRALPSNQNQGGFQRREGGRPTGGSPRNGGYNNNRSGGGAPNRNSSYGGGANRNASAGGHGGNFGGSRSTASSKDDSFEAMLSRFMKSSDDKISDMKQPERRRGYRKDSRDYN